MISIVVEGIAGNGSTSIKSNRFTGIGINVETREVTTSNIEANTMALFEQVAGGIEADLKLIYLSGLHQLALPAIIAVSSAQDTIGQVQGVAPGIIRVRRIDIDELGGEIGVRR